MDPPREDSADTIRQAQQHGIEVKMVTGDNVAIAKEISGQLGLGTNIHLAQEFFKGDGDPENLTPAQAAQIEACDGFAQVFPEHKFKIVKALQSRGHIVGMTGDGVNDAPALKQANTGIAVGFVWANCLAWVFIEDWAKLHVYHHMELSASHHRQFLRRLKSSLHAHPAC